MAEELVTKYMNDMNISHSVRRIFDVLVRKIRLHNMINRFKFNVETVENTYNLAVNCSIVLADDNKIADYCTRIEEDIMLNLVKYTIG